MIADIETLLRFSAETLLKSPYASGFDLRTICEMMEKKIEKPDFEKESHGNTFREVKLEQAWNSPRKRIERKRFEVWIDVYRRNR